MQTQSQNFLHSTHEPYSLAITPSPFCDLHVQVMYMYFNGKESGERNNKYCSFASLLRPPPPHPPPHLYPAHARSVAQLYSSYLRIPTYKTKAQRLPSLRLFMAFTFTVESAWFGLVSWSQSQACSTILQYTFLAGSARLGLLAMQRICLPLLLLDTKVLWQTLKSTPASSLVAPSRGAKSALTNPMIPRDN